MAQTEWDFGTGLLRAQAYCAAAEHCRYDVSSLLARHNVTAADRNRILDRLVADAFLDESRYARAFVSDKLRFDGWGRRKIEQALRMKSVDSAAVEQALKTIDMDDYMKILAKSFKECMSRTKAPDDRTRRMKVLRSMVQRGFEPALVMRLTGDCDIQDLE